MTEEQYKRAIQISTRLGELERVKKEIEGTAKHCLWYAEQRSCSCGYRLTEEWVMTYISKFLDKHDKMIRQEIDEEIERLKAEIETL